MQNKITINEASTLTGKHKDTIRRLIKRSINSRYVTKTSRGYLIDKTWLVNQYQEAEDSGESTGVPVDGDYLQALVNQLEAKDKQISKLQDIVSEKEANNTKILDQFQQLLAVNQLPANATILDNEDSKVSPTKTKRKTPVVKTATKPKAKSKTSKKKPAIKKPPAKKRRWYQF